MQHEDMLDPHWLKKVFALGIGWFLVVAATNERRSAILQSVRMEHHGGIIQIHFGLSGKPHWRVMPQGDQLRIELDNTRLNLPARPLYGDKLAPLKLMRTVPTDNGNVLLIFGLSEKTDYAVAVLPDEILVRLAPAGSVPDLGKPALISTKRQNRSEPLHAGANPAKRTSSSGFHRPLTPIKLEAAPVIKSNRLTIIIDPGHGGHDPGTQAAAPVPEKDVALDIARRLKQSLERLGVNAVLTRDGDYFLPLHERTRLANQANADLFVSVHLNSSPNASTSGLEIYYLNNTTDRATIRLARMENQAGGYHVGRLPNLNYILSDLRQQYKAAESAALARTVNTLTVRKLRQAFGSEVYNLGARRGPFYVLVGAHMPAILIECGFLSNPGEAHRLTDPGYQQGLAGSIAESIVEYFTSERAAGNL